VDLVDLVDLVDCLVKLTIWKSRTYVHIQSLPAKENYTPENPPKLREEIYDVTGRRKSANVLSLTLLTARNLDGRIPSTSGVWFSSQSK
jgi:hypothetical protein